MTQSHTPGPWNLSDFGGGRTLILTTIDPHDRFSRVAVIHSGNLLWCVEDSANASLIAAAPELLRELTHLASLLHPWIEAGNTVPGIATLNGAWAVIRKATGAA